MIESINNAGGGGGGGVQSVTAGTGITVDNTNPDAPIVNLGAHTHAASDITTGTVATARLATGTASNGTFLRGDQTWSPAPVTSVNSLTGAVTLNAASVGAAATSHTHDASAIVSGTVATARLGTGTASSSTYLKGDQTYSSIDAGHITTGTLGTARLASGTANSTTFLRGDQTWATISAGDTVYTVTAADAENTTSEVAIWSFTVPANTWNLGEVIWVPHHVQSLQNSGSSIIMWRRLYVNGVQVFNEGSNITTSNAFKEQYVEYHMHRLNSNSIRVASTQNLTTVRPAGNDYYSDLVQQGITTQTYNPVVNFATALTIQMRIAWATANPSAYVRVLNARAYKPAGQVT